MISSIILKLNMLLFGENFSAECFHLHIFLPYLYILLDYEVIINEKAYF